MNCCRAAPIFALHFGQVIVSSRWQICSEGSFSAVPAGQPDRPVLRFSNCRYKPLESGERRIVATSNNGHYRASGCIPLFRSFSLRAAIISSYFFTCSGVRMALIFTCAFSMIASTCGRNRLRAAFISSWDS